ncbi:MAG: hypothetical protein ACQESH_04175 [Campylobacterota bacterium]
MSVVYIDENKEFFYCQDNKCTPLESRIKHEAIVANIDPKKVITHSFKIPLNISQSELDLEVEMKLYDEAGLNAADDYKIDYIVKELNIEETENMVEAFAVKMSDLENTFAPLLEKVRHIDLITVPYIAYQGLYERKVLEPKNDVFVHLDRNSSYIVLCKEGKYIYARNISDLSMLSSGIDKDLDIDLEQYITILHEKGLNKDRYNGEQEELFEVIQEQFQAIYNRINDTVMYNRNIFGFENADRIFIDCADGWIEGVDTFIHEMMFDKAQILSLKENLNMDEKMLSTADCISAQYAMLHLEIKPNLTIYPRKQPLHKTFLAKLFYSSAAAVFLVSVYPLYLLYEKEQLLQEIEQNEQRLQTRQNEQMQLMQKIKVAQEQIERTKKQIKDRAALEKQMLQSVQDVIDIDEGNKLDLEFIEDATKLLQRYTLKIDALSKESEGYVVSLYTPYNTRDLVTGFMDGLLRLGYSEVSTEKIYTDAGRYNATIKIER